MRGTCLPPEMDGKVDLLWRQVESTYLVSFMSCRSFENIPVDVNSNGGKAFILSSQI